MHIENWTPHAYRKFPITARFEFILKKGFSPLIRTDVLIKKKTPKKYKFLRATPEVFQALFR
jgi:hypothetical protein